MKYNNNLSQIKHYDEIQKKITQVKSITTMLICSGDCEGFGFNHEIALSAIEAACDLAAEASELMSENEFL
ncbi:hypothetical protein RHO15_09535 [Utexia brackfieldae]|uniref:hypothetical protein n=1 Tax=Utexia brackfieldae TaxID=3074108 RepID=UPI00370D2E37